MGQNYGHAYKKQRETLFHKWEKNNYFDNPKVDMLGFLLYGENTKSAHHIFNQQNQCVGLAYLGRKSHDYLDSYLKAYDKAEYARVNDFLALAYTITSQRIPLSDIEKKYMRDCAHHIAMTFDEESRKYLDKSTRQMSKRNHKKYNDSDLSVGNKLFLMKKIIEIKNKFYLYNENNVEFSLKSPLPTFKNSMRDWMGNPVLGSTDVSSNYPSLFITNYSSSTLNFLKGENPALCNEWLSFLNSIKKINNQNKSEIFRFHIELCILREKTYNYYNSRFDLRNIPNKRVNHCLKALEYYSKCPLQISLNSNYVYDSEKVQEELDEIFNGRTNTDVFSTIKSQCDHESDIIYNTKPDNYPYGHDWMGIKIDKNNCSFDNEISFLTTDSSHMLSFIRYTNKDGLYKKWTDVLKLYKVIDTNDFNQVVYFHDCFTDVREKTKQFFKTLKSTDSKNNATISKYLELLDEDNINICINDGYIYSNKLIDFLKSHLKLIPEIQGSINIGYDVVNYKMYNLTDGNINCLFNKKSPMSLSHFSLLNDFMGNEIDSIPNETKKDLILSETSLKAISILTTIGTQFGYAHTKGITLYIDWKKLFKKYPYITNDDVSLYYNKVVNLRKKTADWFEHLSKHSKTEEEKKVYAFIEDSFRKPVNSICFNKNITYNVINMASFKQDDVLNKLEPYAIYENMFFDGNKMITGNQFSKLKNINKDNLNFDDKINDDFLGIKLTNDNVYLGNLFESNKFLISKVSAEMLWYLRKNNHDLFRNWKILLVKYEHINDQNYVSILDELLFMRKVTREYFEEQLLITHSDKYINRFNKFISALTDKKMNISVFNDFIDDKTVEEESKVYTNNVISSPEIDICPTSLIDTMSYDELLNPEKKQKDDIKFKKDLSPYDVSNDEKLNFLFYTFLFGRGSELTKEIRNNNPQLYLNWLSFFKMLTQDYEVFKTNGNFNILFVSMIDKKLSSLKKETLSFLRKQMRDVKNSHDKREYKKLISVFSSNNESFFISQINETYTCGTSNKYLKNNYNYVLNREESLDAYAYASIYKLDHDDITLNESQLITKNDLRNNYKYMSIRNKVINSDYCLNNKQKYKAKENEKLKYNSEEIYHDDNDILSFLKDNKFGLYHEWMELLSQMSKTNSLRKTRDLENKQQQLLAKTNIYINKINSKAKLRRREPVFKR